MRKEENKKAENCNNLYYVKKITENNKWRMKKKENKEENDKQD